MTQSQNLSQPRLDNLTLSLKEGWQAYAEAAPRSCPERLTQVDENAEHVVVVDAFPGLGKTTAVLSFAKKLHVREVSLNGKVTEQGNERWPVCRIGLTGNTGTRDFSKAMVDFYGHPGSNRGTTSQFVQRALDCVLACETKVLIIDDV
uniref:AAA family ATPase n=1 Tax=Nocardia vaccinii TaxID=1822 RepID=UPI000A78537A